MKTISRNHQFENRLTLIQQKRKYFYLYWEKSNNPVIIPRTKERDQKFNEEDWEYFHNESKYFI